MKCTADTMKINKNKNQSLIIWHDNKTALTKSTAAATTNNLYFP
jgi:hypothetical protein